MLIAVAVIALLIATGLLAVGMRGRRKDDHPLCRRCGYDLTGRAAETTRCGECGADLSQPKAIRVGHRVRRRGLLAVGTLLLLLALAVLGLAGWVQSRDVDLTPYKPVWWLRHDLDGGPAAQALALSELTARLNAGQLSAGQVAAVADRALAAQAGPGLWVDGWGTFVETARSAGQLDRPRWATYLRQALTGVAVTAPSAVRQGDPIPLSVALGRPRSARAIFTAYFDVGTLRLDGQAIGEPRLLGSIISGHGGQIECHGSGWGMSYDPAEVDGSHTRGLGMGGHTVSTMLRIDLYDTADLMRNPFGPDPPPDSAKRLATFGLPMSTRFKVVPPRPTVPRVTTATRRAAVSAALRDVSVVQQDDRLVVVRARLDRPPVRLSFAVAVRSAGGVELGVQGLWTCAGGSSASPISAVLGSLGSATHVDLICRPDPGLVDERSDLTPIWGEPVVVHNVPVTRPSAAATQ